MPSYYLLLLNTVARVRPKGVVHPHTPTEDPPAADWETDPTTRLESVCGWTTTSQASTDPRGHSTGRTRLPLRTNDPHRHAGTSIRMELP